MRRTVIAAMLLVGGVLYAQADNDIYMEARKGRTADSLQGATDYCTQKVGPNLNGRPTSAAFKRCMLSRGWRFVRTVRVHTWIDEDGLTCYNSGGATHCSNH
jgi:hypothetical protein